MAKQLAALLGGGLDMKALAELLRRQGRGQDTVLAHITPQEAALLKSRGGAGTMNPETGLPEFQSDYGDDYSGVDLGVYSQPVNQSSIQSTDIMPTPETGGEPVTPTYGTVAQRFEPPVEIPSYAQDLYPPVQPAFRPSMDYGIGMTGAATETYDRGLPQPQRDLTDLLKSGAKQVLGTREGLAGLGTLASVLQARQAGQQARRMQQELGQLGAPQRAMGEEMMRLGQAGQVTPVQRQQLEALAARERQQLAQRGLTSGTAQQQAGARQVERQQRAAQDLLDEGLKVAGIGNQYQAAAIKAGYAADQATRDMLNTTLTNLYRTIYGNTEAPVKTTPGKG